MMDEKRIVSSTLRPSIRFEVFKRDSFKCQYCGAIPPRVTLEVDHIHPRSERGDDSLLNLITACHDCNIGKGARQLSDDSIVVRQHAQLEELNERRLQMDMMIEWRESLKALRNQEVDAIDSALEKATTYSFSDSGRLSASKWLSRFSLLEILDALDSSVNSYLRYGDAGRPTTESVEKVIQYTPRIASITKRGGLTEHERRLFYIRGVLRNRLYYFNESLGMRLLKDAVAAGCSLDDLEDFAKEVRNWTNFRSEMERVSSEAESSDFRGEVEGIHEQLQGVNGGQQTPPAIEEFQINLWAHLHSVSNKNRAASLERLPIKRACSLCKTRTYWGIAYQTSLEMHPVTTHYYCQDHVAYGRQRAAEWMEREPLCHFCNYYHGTDYLPCRRLRQFYFDLTFEAIEFGTPVPASRKPNGYRRGR